MSPRRSPHSATAQGGDRHAVQFPGSLMTIAIRTQCSSVCSRHDLPGGRGIRRLHEGPRRATALAIDVEAERRRNVPLSIASAAQKRHRLSVGRPNKGRPTWCSRPPISPGRAAPPTTDYARAGSEAATSHREEFRAQCSYIRDLNPSTKRGGGGAAARRHAFEISIRRRRHLDDRWTVARRRWSVAHRLRHVAVSWRYCARRPRVLLPA